MTGDVISALLPDPTVISQWSVFSFCVAVMVYLGCWLARRIVQAVEEIVVWLLCRGEMIDRHAPLDIDRGDE
jgi:hypothetical protein